MIPAVERLLGTDPGMALRALGVVLIVFAIDTLLVARSKGRLGRLRIWIANANLASAALGALLLVTAHAALSRRSASPPWRRSRSRWRSSACGSAGTRENRAQRALRNPLRTLRA